MISDSAIAHLRAVAQQPDLSGTPYRLVREIGRGGMAVVYEAIDERLNRPVALKVLALEISTPDSALRMTEEARTIARLEHPGIVPIHDIGTLPDGRVYYTMRLVRGTTLSDVAEAAGRAALLRLFLRICDAVAFAHAAGIVHRDLKPQNIMIGAFGDVLVMDWGVAAAVDEQREIAGTKGFMAPEQLRGARVDRRADVYALGAILDRLARAEGTPPRALQAIAQKATSEDVQNRYADAQQLAADVARFIDGEPVSAYRENALEIVERWIRRNLALVSIVAAYIVTRVIIFLWMRL